MIPLIGGAIAVVATTANAVGFGAMAGMGYGLGRKYGRQICEWSDSIEERIRMAMLTQRELA